jgi:hypothetical protein
MTRPNPSRRDLLRAAGAAAVTAGAVPRASARPRLAFPNSEPLRLGLVGCGGRGTGAAANALRADENVTLVAMGDAFADQVDASYESLAGAEDLTARVQVDEEHKFAGFDAFKRVIDDCDVVCLATPPHFRPEHLEYAVEKGEGALTRFRPLLPLPLRQAGDARAPARRRGR